MEAEFDDWKNIQSVFVIDDLYEHINAPQWVDFSSDPLIDQPDDHLWFCRPECNHPTTAEDFLIKQLPCVKKFKKSASFHEVTDSSLNSMRSRMLKKASKCENHNPTKQHKISSKNLFAGDWPISEFYCEFKKKLAIRTNPEEMEKKLFLPHQNKLKLQRSSRTTTLQQVGGRGILQEVEEESTNVKVVNGDNCREKKEEKSLDFFWFLKPCTFPSSS